MRTITESTRKEELDKLTACYRKLIYMTIVLVGLAVASLITALFKAMLPSVLFLAAMFLARVTLHKKARDDYRQAITDTALVCSVGVKLDEFDLSAKGGTGITKEEVLAAELYPIKDNSPDSIGLYQGISGTSREMGVSLNDISLQQYKEAGHKGVAITCGVWMHFALPEDTGLDLRILSGELLPDDLRKEYFRSLPNLKRKDPRDYNLDKTLFLYSAGSPADSGSGSDDGSDITTAVSASDTAAVSDDGNAEPDMVSVSATAAVPGFEALPPSFLTSVNSLIRKCNGKLGISLKGSSLDFFFKDRFLAPPYRLNVKPDERFLQYEPVPEFREALNLAKKL